MKVKTDMHTNKSELDSIKSKQTGESRNGGGRTECQRGRKRKTERGKKNGEKIVRVCVCVCMCTKVRIL